MIWDGVRSDPPRTECVVRSKKFQKVGEGGVLGGPQKTKSAQNYYLGIVKKFQNNRISHFLTVDFQKMEVRSDPPHKD